MRIGQVRERESRHALLFGKMIDAMQDRLGWSLMLNGAFRSEPTIFPAKI
jgi:hypothetical protein